ncbi:MAG: type IV secretion system DNA-binding domain-containing protein [bacterium]|nr:type IV secretion system DNA-binding domain-containing protein [bacterium]
MPVKSKKDIVVIGETNFRNQRWRFGIKEDDRRRHMYVVGSTGMGKTEFLKNMAIQDIEAGRGLALIDPHGDPSDQILDHIPADRVKDVIYFDPSDLEFPIAFNIMAKVDYDYRHLIASGLLGVFKKIWGAEVWSGRMEYILNNTILALLEYPDSTLLGINRMMSVKSYRNKVIANLKDPIVKSFWVDEFAKYADRFATEATAAIQNKVGQFSSNNVIRNIIGQVNPKFDVRKIMDEGKILIVNVSKGKIGEDASRLLGALLITKIQLAAMSRVDTPEQDRRDFCLYVDEFQNFATESFANILSEARKFHLSLVIAHQYIKQMEEPVRDAVFGNVGTIVSFRVGAEDAEFLEKWFSPDFLMADIINLGKYNMYLKLMIDGVSSRGFSAAAIPPLPRLEKSSREAIIEYSRKTYATPRSEVEKDVAAWALANEEDKKPQGGGGYGGSRPAYGQFRSEERRPSEERGSTEHRNANVGNTEASRPNVEQSRSRPPQFENRESPQFQQRPISDRSPINPEYRLVDKPQGRTIGLEPRVVEPVQTPTEFRAQQQQVQQQSQSSGLSFDDALRQGPVNFRGKKIEGKRERPKVEVNTDALKKVLEEAMGKKE